MMVPYLLLVILYFISSKQKIFSGLSFEQISASMKINSQRLDKIKNTILAIPSIRFSKDDGVVKDTNENHTIHHQNNNVNSRSKIKNFTKTILVFHYDIYKYILIFFYRYSRY